MESCSCPRIVPAEWDGTRHRWAARVFLRQPLRCLFGVPMNAGAALAGLQKSLASTGCRPAGPQMLLYRLNRFSGELLLAVEPPAGPLPAGCLAAGETYFISVVHEGSAGSAAPAVARLRSLAASDGAVLRSVLYRPVSCRACAGERGGMRTVVLGVTGGDGAL